MSVLAQRGGVYGASSQNGGCALAKMVLPDPEQSKESPPSFQTPLLLHAITRKLDSRTTELSLIFFLPAC